MNITIDGAKRNYAKIVKASCSEGWAYLANRYDDLAFYDGKLDRPVLQRLLKDAEAGPIDVVMAYKIDRLTCSPSDFVQLVEVSTHI